MFDVLGVLFKRCTLLLSTKDRLKFIFSKISQVRKGQVRCQAITEYCNFLNELHLFLIFLSEGNNTSGFCNVLQKLKKNKTLIALLFYAAQYGGILTGLLIIIICLMSGN